MGLKLNQSVKAIPVPKEIEELIEERNRLRKEGNYSQADEIRLKIEKAGFKIKDKKIPE